MKIRLTRKLADFLDGVDLRSFEVGDVVEMSSSHAKLLIAEGWAAEPVPAAKRVRSETVSPSTNPREERQIRDSIDRERVRASAYEVPPAPDAQDEPV